MTKLKNSFLKPKDLNSASICYDFALGPEARKDFLFLYLNNDYALEDNKGLTAVIGTSAARLMHV